MFVVLLLLLPSTYSMQPPMPELVPLVPVPVAPPPPPAAADKPKTKLLTQRSKEYLAGLSISEPLPCNVRELTFNQMSMDMIGVDTAGAKKVGDDFVVYRITERKEGTLAKDFVQTGTAPPTTFGSMSWSI